jgi:hypothetical protein
MRKESLVPLLTQAMLKSDVIVDFSEAQLRVIEELVLMILKKDTVANLSSSHLVISSMRRDSIHHRQVVTY